MSIAGDKNFLVSRLKASDRTPKNLMKNRIFEEYSNYLNKLKVEFNDNYKRKIECSVKIDDFQITACLGIGAFGQVLLVKQNNTNKYYAIKVLSKQRIIKEKQIEHTLSEKYILQAIRFPFCIYMEYCFKDNSYVYFVMPYLAGGDMFTYLRRCRSFKEKDAKFYGAQICLALEYLHHLELVFRDLKPENIMIDPIGYIRLTDFGFCKLVPDRTYTLCGTPEYIAPEIILSKGYSKAVDWWSFGVFLYEMIAGYTPFVSDDPMQIYEKITYGKYKFTQAFSTEAKDIVKNLLQVDLSKRFGNLKDGVIDIKNHTWFKIIDWQAIHNRKTVSPYIPKIKSPTDTSNFDQFSTMPSLRPADTDKFAEEFIDF